MSLFKIFDIAGSAMSAQSQKMQVHASNLANSDSLVNKNGKLYPYISKRVVLQFDNFKGSKSGGVKVKEIVEDKMPCRVIYDPNSPIANSKGFAKTSNVNIVSETISAISASRNYQANLEILNTIKFMIMKTLTIGQ
ncbi:flagellar basal body rod protein FlgC [Buchnera aphidicola]|uniref:Flagellar basal-body rod protein FlgC n=1 Tax=Buchnera aphidicola subsp. Melaphis rhois TaxID=118103 RepID=A0A4D6YG73_BUCMH|nr:flagellar basal body rod protein FlgC [Buchnera aphidicola]QCI23335.1 flagellar basal body rod protein FlgC [Buchnera aphidicola (Melaphis rhois)]